MERGRSEPLVEVYYLTHICINLVVVGFFVCQATTWCCSRFLCFAGRRGHNAAGIIVVPGLSVCFLLAGCCMLLAVLQHMKVLAHKTSFRPRGPITVSGTSLPLPSWPLSRDSADFYSEKHMIHLSKFGYIPVMRSF